VLICVSIQYQRSFDILRVGQRVLSDNMRQDVNKNNRYEPCFNETAEQRSIHKINPLFQIKFRLLIHITENHLFNNNILQNKKPVRCIIMNDAEYRYLDNMKFKVHKIISLIRNNLEYRLRKS